MKTLKDFEKALILLYITEDKPFGGPNWGSTTKEKQENLLAALCFNGDTERAINALREAQAMGLVDATEPTKRL